MTGPYAVEDLFFFSIKKEWKRERGGKKKRDGHDLKRNLSFVHYRGEGKKKNKKTKGKTGGAKNRVLV